MGFRWKLCGCLLLAISIRNNRNGYVWVLTLMSAWKEMLTEQQRKILNAACGDLADQISWHGFKLSKDDWRHMLSGTIKGWRLMPAIDRGQGNAGLIMLGASSLSLSKEDCIDAITQAFVIGDDPSSQGLNCKPVRWCSAVCKARWLTDEREAA